jgi:hypothetical protein
MVAGSASQPQRNGYTEKNEVYEESKGLLEDLAGMSSIDHPRDVSLRDYMQSFPLAVYDCERFWACAVVLLASRIAE